MTEYDGKPITYDAVGNPLSYRDAAMSWTRGRMMASYDKSELSATYTYNAEGFRTRKRVVGDFQAGNFQNDTHTYWLDGSRIWQEERQTRNRWFMLTYYYDQTGICGFSDTGLDYYFVKNLQGDVTHIYDMRDRLVGRYSYDAWGVCTVVVDVDGVASANMFRYRGYYWDSESGFYYLNSRYYDPVIGRFISPDDVQFLEPDEINGLNLYAYCGNNPVMNVDPEGTNFFSRVRRALTIVAGAAMVVAGAAVAVAGLALKATGVGAVVGKYLTAAGTGFAIGAATNLSKQIREGGDINLGQVAFNGAMGAATGALMVSPLGIIPTAAAIGGVNFVRSVGNDLIDSGGDFGEVNWARAAILGVAAGAISGAGRALIKIGNFFGNLNSNILRNSIPNFGVPLEKVIKNVTTGIRTLVTSLISRFM